MGLCAWLGCGGGGVGVAGGGVRGPKASTWLGERLLQEWGHWCIQYLESFGTGGGAMAGRDDGARRGKRAPGDHSDPVLAELIGTEIMGGLSQTIHLRIAERRSVDRRVAMLRYVGKPVKLPEWGGSPVTAPEPVIWRGEVSIGGGRRGLIEFPEPEMLKAVCIPPDNVSPENIGRELGVTATEVREATRRLRAMAVNVYRSMNVKRKAA